MERRQQSRRQALLLTEIRVPGGQRARGLIYNVSQDGMFVLTRSALDLEQNVYVQLPALIGQGATVWLVAQVVHRNDHGVGLAFGELTDMVRAMTEALL